MVRGIILSTMAWFLAGGSAHARPAHKLALAQYFGPFLPKKLNDCRTCHLPEAADKNGDDLEKPHNPFGARIKAARQELKKAAKSPTIEAALDMILDEDSDGDGVSNRIEILTGHFPGDKEDRPTAAEIASAKALLVEFAKLKSGHPWRPYEPVTRPAVPMVKNRSWVRNPIDAFIAAEQEALGLTPRPEAPPEVLLRRVYLDLIGLPPTPAEIEAFAKDCAQETESGMRNPESGVQAADSAFRIPDSVWCKWVSRLLDDPRYGERWGRHWMDVWRYSDWAGYGPQVRDSQPHIWHWRDWIIDSLNTDKGYDRMVLEMLAGDELAPEDPKALAGTGYLVRNWKLLSREKWIQDTVEHTAMAFLAMTLQCAKCHDHMFDPIPQKDYYQFRAIFEPHDVRMDHVPGQPDPKKDGLPRVYDKDLAAKTFLFIRGDDRTPDKTKPIEPGVPDALGGCFHVESVSLPKITNESDPVPLPEKKNTKKEAKKDKIKEAPSFPTTSTGRRLALARWIANAENPRTARVAVNHIWLRHFGQALVPSVFDFGKNGRPPSHPALLDWLAAEFMNSESGIRISNSAWSMKHLHRLIVTSSTYRMASTPDAADAALDRDNKYLWRYPPHRLEAEAVRDSIFYVAGKLDPRMSGPDIDYPLGLTLPRRSLYFRHAAEKEMEFLSIFDAANVTECYERKHSIIPQQALALVNSELTLKSARILARAIAAKTNGDASAFTTSAFLHVLSRHPTAVEKTECVAFLREQARRLQAPAGPTSLTPDGALPAPDPALRARENLVHVLMNHHEFVTMR